MLDSGWDVLVLAGAYAAGVYGAGRLIGLVLTEPVLTPPRLPIVRGVSTPMLIGWLERFLVITLVLVGELTAVGFIVVAKTILRFDDVRDAREHAEYVLCGTLASFSAALVVGVAARWLMAMV
ncbi:hypothetical protein HQ576_19645 [bacterium]|nr:hypothetical protein [bacterium]